MKKILYLIFIILFFPINIFAYSDYVIPGGESIGINIDSKGLVVVGFYKVNGNYIGKNFLKVGDTIISINDTTVNSISDLTNVIDNNLDDELNIIIKRNNKEINTKMSIEM